jgi:hypothetical protein
MLSQCSKCGLSKSSGAMGSVLPQCQCDWKTLSKEDAPLVKWAKEQTAPQRTWVGLAKEDRLCAKYMQDAPDGIEAVIDYIESKLKELNI